VDAPLDIHDICRKIDSWLAATDENTCKEIAFYGNDFASFPLKFLDQLGQHLSDYVHRGQVTGIRISVRPDTVIKMESINDYGITTVELGVPTMDRDVLHNINRNHTPESVSEAVDYLKAHNISVGIQTMIGLPGADDQEAVRTAVQIADMQPDFVRIHPVLVLADTALEQDFHDGKYCPLSLDDAVRLCTDVFGIYRRNNIAVARIGFHLPEDLRTKILVAGPFHPCFGALVKGEFCYEELRKRLLENPELTQIEVPLPQISDYLGYKKSNLKKLRNEFSQQLTITGKHHPYLNGAVTTAETTPKKQ